MVLGEDSHGNFAFGGSRCLGLNHNDVSAMSLASLAASLPVQKRDIQDDNHMKQVMHISLETS